MFKTNLRICLKWSVFKDGGRDPGLPSIYFLPQWIACSVLLTPTIVRLEKAVRKFFEWPQVLKATNLIDVRCTYRRVKTYVFFVKTQSGDYIQFKITAATATPTECISGHKEAYHVIEDTYTFLTVCTKAHIPQTNLLTHFDSARVFCTQRYLHIFDNSHISCKRRYLHIFDSVHVFCKRRYLHIFDRARIFR